MLILTLQSYLQWSIATLPYIYNENNATMALVFGFTSFTVAVVSFVLGIRTLRLARSTTHDSSD